jgi:hypothetical protein
MKLLYEKEIKMLCTEMKQKELAIKKKETRHDMEMNESV